MLQGLLFTFLLFGFSRLPGTEPAPGQATVVSELTADIQIDSIAVHKAKREMLVFSNHQLLKKYRIHLGINPIGPKQVQGDYKTPEGLYRISGKYPTCSYHRALGISYPNVEDVKRAKQFGKSPGGDILIHGLPNGRENLGPRHFQNDWTWGCIAVTNQEIDEIYAHIKPGVPILITP